MNAETERVYRALRQSYLTEAPARLAELRKEAEAFRAGESQAAEWLRSRIHKLVQSSIFIIGVSRCNIAAISCVDAFFRLSI